MRLGRLAALVASLAAGPAEATEWGNFPDIGGTVPMAEEIDFNFDQNRGVDDYWVGQIDIEPDLTIDFLPGPPNLVLYAQAVLGMVKDPNPGSDSWFKATGLYMPNLNLTYGNGRYQAMGGKFTASFGRAWDLAPDLFGQDFAGDYEYDENWGFGGQAVLGQGEYGFHALSAEAFFADDTVLSESVFSDRGRNRRNDGGPGNTGEPDSFTLAYDMNGYLLPIGRGQVDTQIAFMRLAEGESSADETSQKSVAASAVFSIPILSSEYETVSSSYLEVQPLVEYVHIWDTAGIDDQSSDYLTLATNAVCGAWGFGTAYTWRHDNMVGDHDTSHLVTVQGSYLFTNQLAIELGWSWRTDMGQESQIIGLQFSYEYDW